MRGNYRWKDKEVSSWAKAYLDEKCTLADLEGSLGVQHSTLWWCFTHRLGDIDSDSYIKVLEQLKYNKTHPRRVKRSSEATHCEECNLKVVVPARLKMLEGQG